MPTYRLLLHGEGRRPDGGFFGFYAGRELFAADLGDAVRRSTQALEEDWAGSSSYLGTLDVCGVISVWPKPRLAFGWLPNAGHTLYDDKPDDKRAALELEAKISRLPAAERRRLIGEL